MGTLSPEAARLKYEYNKKSQDRYWEKKAQQKQGVEPKQKTVRGRKINLFKDEIPEAEEQPTVSRADCKGDDERYINGLEVANKCMRSENRRLCNLLHKYQDRIEKIEKLLKQKN